MTKDNKLPKIAAIISTYNLSARKSFGQHFLLDLNLTSKIAKSAGNLDSFDILEIGPGPGSLTRSILESGARKVVAIEQDERFLPALRGIEEFYPNKFVVLHGNALSLDPRPYLEPPIKVIANLPYNVGTQILINFLTKENWPPFWNSLTLMFQKEVAERIVAKPNSKSFGRLSVISQWRTDARLVFTVPASAFTPAPKVESAIVQFTPLHTPLYASDQKNLEKLTRIAFGKRRKMLRQSLKLLNPNIERILSNICINPELRPEQLSVRQFCLIAEELKNELTSYF